MPEEKIADSLEQEDESLLEKEEKSSEEESKEEEEKKEEEQEEEEKEYTQEELDEIWAKHEADQLKELGLSQFKTYEEAAKNLARILDEDKVAYPIVQRLATKYAKSPVEFMKAIEAQLAGKETPKKGDQKPKDDPYAERFKKLESGTGRIHLDLGFDKFQRKMEKEETDIPDKLKKPLIKLLPVVTANMTEDELENASASELFESAYSLYLWNLSNEKDPSKLKGDLEALSKAKAAKLKQLGMPAGKKTIKGVSSQDVKDYGEGITKL